MNTHFAYNMRMVWIWSENITDNYYNVMSYVAHIFAYVLHICVDYSFMV